MVVDKKNIKHEETGTNWSQSKSFTFTKGADKFNIGFLRIKKIGEYFNRVGRDSSGGKFKQQEHYILQRPYK